MGGKSTISRVEFPPSEEVRALYARLLQESVADALWVLATIEPWWLRDALIYHIRQGSLEES